MSDYNSGLPIRTQADGTDERLHVKIVDGTTPAQRAIVDTDGNVHIEVHGNNPAGTDTVLKLSEDGSSNNNGRYNATTNSIPSSTGLIGHVRGATPGLADLTNPLTSITNGTVHALDISLYDEAGAPFTDLNPLPVYMAADPGTEVVNYDTASAVAAGASSNHSYAVPTGTFEVHKVWGTSSGKLKIEVQWSTDGVAFTTLAVGFNSTATPNIDLEFSVPYSLAGSGTSSIRVIRTNRDNQSADLYTTVFGVIK